MIRDCYWDNSIILSDSTEGLNLKCWLDFQFTINLDIFTPIKLADFKSENQIKKQDKKSRSLRLKTIKFLRKIVFFKQLTLNQRALEPKKPKYFWGSRACHNLQIKNRQIILSKILYFS